MLKDILRELNSSGAFSITKIASNLNLTEEMVQDGIKQLIRMEYLKEDLGSPSCGGKCNGCAAANCKIIPIKTFSITEKGMKLIS